MNNLLVVCAVLGAGLDGLILAWLVYTDTRDRREKRVKAICPECLEEHEVPVLDAHDVVQILKPQK